ncbi:MAG: sigma-54-dependent Fis family transcriptional regulator, partial [Gammaproteobacteria bacterium]|nr:sigma-54-dependent Fis family transcriptional regulator [Gammaproteobacteria bacterium]NIR82346.1 sigma-54-dependent Fis family transcriptional regulator [Gammaproteobacteria bacterium]NIR91845.1 sigma-54-dependent Fis family transcriptional regulator [Gammaproteobacteria bacterium]NIU03496.1 sigma-54-dependent Fis family transcriptional regulator [Gammaproteobacteria bacterium]NIV76898.1 response regulator [Gammaproteobacteria bacterium]
MSRILIIEDEVVIRTAVSRLLARNGYEIAQAESVEAARPLLQNDGIDLVIADVRLPGAAGTDIITEYPRLPVLVITSYASVRSAVEAMKLGAVDYIAKPFDHDEMLLCVDRILKHHRLERQNQALKSDVARSYPIAGMIGRCEVMRDVFARIDKVAPTDTTVLILGESGTGKELVARALHEKSERRDAPMITVNCAAIPGGLIENELFGHEKGSFTGAVGAQQGLVEAADGGTLFLDEIGELPPDAQARLLRVLQDGEIRRVGAARPRRVNIRLIAATHRDLPALVREGRFRDDLYFRLRVMEIHLPPLRGRGEDMRELAETLLEKTCRRLNKAQLALSAAALEAILRYDWPGNVRELENAIERAVILCEGPSIGPDLLSIHPSQTDLRQPTAREKHPLPDMSLEEYFRHFVERHQDRLTETELAERLGISRKALWERRQRLG